MTVPVTISPAAPTTPAPTRAQRLEAMIAEDAKTPTKAEEPKAPEPVKAEEPKAVAKVEEPKAPEGVPDRIKQSFERLAVETAAFRKEREAAKPYMEALKVFSPIEAAALAKAKASGDPLAVLTAAGFSYADVANRMVDLSAARKKETPPAAAEETPSKVAPEVEELRKEIADMRAWRAEQQKQQVLTRIREAVKDRPEIAVFAKAMQTDAGAAVLSRLEEYINSTGRLPGETFEESVAVAAEAIEQRAKEFRAAFGGGVSSQLTPPAESSTVTQGDRETPAGPEKTGQQTITNDATTAPRTDGLKKSREDRFKEVLADPTLW